MLQQWLMGDLLEDVDGDGGSHGGSELRCARSDSDLWDNVPENVFR